MEALLAVYLREMLLLKRRFRRIAAGMSVSPVLYIVAFGYAMGPDIRIDGHSYREFLIPGLVAMSSMNQAFGVATDINIARFYLHIFEEFQAAPLTNFAYVLGEVLAGMTRALLSVVIIISVGACFGIVLHYGPLFWLAVLLNSFVFAALAVLSAMIVKSHADQAALSNFIITPIAFLGGTFFPLDRLPDWAQHLLTVIPLTHASTAIRTEAFAGSSAPADYLVLSGLGLLTFCLALRSVDMARD